MFSGSLWASRNCPSALRKHRLCLPDGTVAQGQTMCGKLVIIVQGAKLPFGGHCVFGGWERMLVFNRLSLFQEFHPSTAGLARGSCFPVITLFIVTLGGIWLRADVRLSLGVGIFLMMVLHFLTQLHWVALSIGKRQALVKGERSDFCL